VSALMKRPLKKGKPNRVLLKVSGESLMGERDFGLDYDSLHRIAEDIFAVHSTGVQVCLVVGAGNIFRGLSGSEMGIERTTADGMGMLATVINSLAMQSVLEGIGADTRVQSAIPINSICEPYIRRKAVRHLTKGRIVIFAAGTGNPFFTTDTAAALRAAEMSCDLLLKGTQVDGVYTKDPKLEPSAERYDRLSFTRVLREDLKVMDAAAISLARDNNIPIMIFSIHDNGAFKEIIDGNGKFTLIDGSTE